MTADSASSSEAPVYQLIIYYRYKAAEQLLIRQLILEETTEVLDLIDLARSLVAHNLIYEFHISRKTPRKVPDDDLIASWLHLADKAIRDGSVESELA